ncbi:hypothetical protein TNCV_4654621 [Trichonephila clavipes]|nr:hypothetical protein TNCV_4654621 [Trichonephila clavipes]
MDRSLSMQSAGGEGKNAGRQSGRLAVTAKEPSSKDAVQGSEVRYTPNVIELIESKKDEKRFWITSAK